MFYPPWRAKAGEWQVTGEQSDLMARFYDEAQQLQGFALTGACTKGKLALMQAITPLL